MNKNIRNLNEHFQHLFLNVLSVLIAKISQSYHWVIRFHIFIYFLKCYLLKPQSPVWGGGHLHFEPIPKFPRIFDWKASLSISHTILINFKGYKLNVRTYLEFYNCNTQHTSSIECQNRSSQSSMNHQKQPI